MNAGQLREELDNFGDHLEVRIEDPKNDAHTFPVSSVNTQSFDGETIVVLRPATPAR
jgi:hypothetical protein